MKNIFKISAIGMLTLLVAACGSVAPLVSTQVANIDNYPLKTTPLTEEQEKIWWHLDLEKDTVPGMSVIRTYDELIKNKKGNTVIVAIIDSGVDIEHQDLKNVLWVNKKEIAGNGKDDDNNGYIDDIYGWNFLGDIVAENMEYVRIIRKLNPKFEGKSESDISNADREEYALYKKALAELDQEKSEAQANYLQYGMMLEQLGPAHEKVAAKLGKEDYTQEDLKALSEDKSIRQEVFMVSQMLSYGEPIKDILEQLQGGVDYFKSRLDNHFNVETDFRKTLGDNPDDINDVPIGNNNVMGPDPQKEDLRHGTHVAGIVAAQRNNGVGMNGVANNVQIMSIRTVPDGDEYDKDVALAIRYAVDNGAKVINASFGKYFSTNPQWVYDALKYAAEHDVLFVHGAGNEGLDLDDDNVLNFPNDQQDNYNEFVNNFLNVGALNPRYGSEMIATFSNYGKSNVDVFAPGVRIYATVQNNGYEFLQGTSMASPAVAGVAAMLRSYYPELTAAQVKQIIMDSGVTTNINVILGGEGNNQRPFSEISKSGKMVNMYNAFLMAEKMTKK
ncbi:MAG TPA: S8 family peptidase [Flavobacteriaceae bacterium]|nr:S8 family peptidase [Flavobacteriaceae bacterium]